LALYVNGALQGTWQAPGEARGWTSHTIQDVKIRHGDELRVDVQTDNAEAGRLDYVQLNERTAQFATSNPILPQVMAAEPLDNPRALPGQIIVAGGRPGYLKINGGPAIFLCGPDNPEEFLFLGKLLPDGTRDGPQMEMIEFLGQTGVNAMHFQMFRMRRCNIKGEGDDTHCPFIDHDPSKPLNEKVLDQWEFWLKELEKRNIIVHLEFYNDATDVELMGWTLDAQGNLHPDERRFIEGIVNRFKHLKNIIWGLEESSNKLPRSRVIHFRKMAELIRQVDEYQHPIVQSLVTPETAEKDMHPDGVTSADYRDNPVIDIMTWLHISPHGKDFEAQHRAYLEYAQKDRDVFILMKNETEYHQIDRRTARVHNWACALAGMHALEAQLNVARADRHDRIVDAGKLVSFMEQTDWFRMKSADDMVTEDAKWALANPGVSYIVYSYDCKNVMGLKNLPQGRYEILWFDTIDGKFQKETFQQAKDGPASWHKPANFSNEVAVYVKRIP